MSDTSLVFNVLAKDKASKTFDKIKGAALVAGVAIGAALANGLTDAFGKEKAADRLAAQVGDAPWASAAGKAAGSLYANAWGESAAQAGDAVRSVMQSGLVGGKAAQSEIEAMTAKVMDLSNAFDQDLTATARAAAQMVRNGLAKDGAQAMDILTKGFQATGDVAGDLLDTYSEYSTKFRDLGLGGAQAMGLLAQGTKAGARDIDTVADALKEFSIRAVDGSKASSAGFKALGLDAKQMTAIMAQGGDLANEGLDTVLDKLRAMKDPVAQNAAAVALFGTKAEDLGSALFALDPSSAEAALGDVTGAAGKLSDTLGDNAATQLEAFKRKVQGALVEQLAKAIPYIRDAATWMEKHKAIVVPLGAALATFAVIVGTIVAISKVWTIVQTALNIAMALNPIGLIIIAIVALIAIIVLIATKTTWFQQLWGAVWGWIKSAAQAVGQWFSGTLWPWLKNLFINIALAITWPTRFAIDKFTQLLAWFKTLPGKIGAIFGKVAEFLTRPFRAAFNAIAGFWNRTLGKMSFTVPSWVPGIGGKGFHLPTLPMLARGGVIARAGSVVVGDAGPEVLDLPRGASVTPLSRAGGGGTTVIEVHSDGTRAGDLITWLIRETVRVKGRGNVQIAFGRGPS